MEIPILLGANPKIANPVEWIPVRFDKWTVRVEGLVDSRLILHSSWPGNGETLREDPVSELALWQGPCQVRVEFKERGNEKAITVFAVEHK